MTPAQDTKILARWARFVVSDASAPNALVPTLASANDLTVTRQPLDLGTFEDSPPAIGIREVANPTRAGATIRNAVSKDSSCMLDRTEAVQHCSHGERPPCSLTPNKPY